MKRMILWLLVLVAMVIPRIAGADMVIDSRYLNSMAVNGVSYFAIDLSKAKWDAVGVQLVGTITQGVAGSGTTIGLSVAGTNTLPTAAALAAGTAESLKLDYRKVFQALNLTSGNSRFVYPVSVEPAKYLVGKATAGVTNLTLTLEFIGREGAGWMAPKVVVLQQSRITMTGGQSGVSTIAQIFGGSIPSGTGYVTVQANSGGSMYYTRDGSTTPVSTGAIPVGSVLYLNGTAEFWEDASSGWFDVGVTTTTLEATAYNRDPYR